MRYTRSLIALLCLTGVAACGPYPQSYTDAAGVYHEYDPATGQYHVTGSNPDVVATTVVEPAYYPETGTTTTTTYTFSRPGYYDRNGYYIATDAGPRVPRGYFPARGLCRVWFPDRGPGAQPAIESCDGIQYRVPAGAYVIYGG